MSRSLSTLLSREMRQTAIYVAALIGASFFTVGVVIVQVRFQLHLPWSIALERSFATPLFLGLVGVMQLVQMTVLKEKAGGGFLFLRMLPVNDAEIISSKLVAILLDVLIMSGIPLMVTTGAMIYYRVAFPVGFWLDAAWLCVAFAALAVAMTACAIRFDSQKAMLFPVVLFSVLLGLGLLVRRYVPAFIGWSVRVGIQDWGIVLAAALVWLGWRGTIHIFSKQDFVQLSE